MTTSNSPIPHIVPDPFEVVPEFARDITGGGIVKTPGEQAAGVDQGYDVEVDPNTGALKVQTTGDMAAQSIEQQTQELTFDEFKTRISSGDIPTVAKIPQGNLQNDILLSDPNTPDVTPENRQAAQDRLENAFLMYSEQQSAVTPVEFGTQTGPGQYVFTPSPEARQNPELLTVQEKIFNGKKAIAQVVSGAFTDRVKGPNGEPLNAQDQAIIQRTFVRNIASGEFWDNLVEKIHEGGLVGTMVYLPDIVVNYGTSAAAAAAKTTVSNLYNMFSDNKGREFLDEWKKGAPAREKASNWWKNVVEDDFSIRQLSSVMNDMVVQDLRRQLDAGDIDQETYDRLTASQTTRIGDREVTVPPRYVNEEIAQVLLNESLNQLTPMENYALVLAEATLTMMGAGKLKQVAGDKNLLAVSKKLDELEDRAKSRNATVADRDRYAELAAMTPIQAGVAMSLGAERLKFNKKAATYALGMEKVSANISKIVDERSALLEDMRRLRLAGTSKFAPQYKELNAAYQRLTGMMVRTYLKGRFVPNFKENLKGAIPLSITMHAFGEYDLFGARTLVGGDRLAAEGLGAMVHLMLGRPAYTIAGKAAYWGNQQLGDGVNIVGGIFESIVSLGPITERLGMNGIRGYLTDGNLNKVKEIYKTRTGDDMTQDMVSALRYVGRIAGSLDDEGLDQVIAAMEKSQQRTARLLNQFKDPEQRRVMRQILKEEFAIQSNIGWLRSANRLAGLEVNAMDSGSLDKLSEMVANQRVIEEGNSKTARLVTRLRELVANQTDLFDPGEVNRYIEAMDAAMTASARLMNKEKAILNQQIDDFRTAVIRDPNTPMPAGLIEGLDELQISLLDKDIDVLKVLEAQFNKNRDLLADRAANISLFRRNDVRHIKYVGQQLEVSVQNRLKRMKDRARSGFIPLDKMAEEGGQSIPINKMILDLMEYAPEKGDSLEAFFAKNSRFFAGTLGRQVYRTANRMAARSLQAMEGDGYDALYRLHTNPKAGDFYLGKDGELKPLDILMFYLDPKNQEKLNFKAPDLLASPGEVMDVYAAFRDYAVRTGDDALASRYADYAEQVEQVVEDGMGKEFADQWRVARETYQAEWFDRLRVGGPLTKIYKSQNGPVAAIEKKGEKLEDAMSRAQSGEAIFFDDVAVGEQIPPEVIPDRLFTMAYTGDTPLDAFDPMLKHVNSAMRGDDDALTQLVKIRNQLIQSFSDIVIEDANEFIFDLTDEKTAKDFALLSSQLTELIYAKWGKNLSKGLEERLTAQIAAEVKSGGYEFEAAENLNQLQDIFKIAGKVKLEDGSTKIVPVYLVDFGEIAEYEQGISSIINRTKQNPGAASQSDLDVLEAYEKFSESVLSKLRAGQTELIANAAEVEDGVKLIGRFYGDTNAQSFFENMVVNGDVDTLNNFINQMYGKLGDTFTTAQGVTYRTEDVLRRGISYLVINGMMQYAGYAPVPGAKSIGMNGQEFTNYALYQPEMLVAALEKKNVRQILSGIMDEEHIQYVSDMAELLSEENAYVMRARGIADDVEPTIKNIVKPYTPGNLMARTFNLARRMVSPQYVTAELAVNLAMQAGLNMMKLAAGNKENAEVMLRLMKFPDQMTKADLDIASNMVVDFVVTELGQLGDEGRDYLEQLLAASEEEDN